MQRVMDFAYDWTHDSGGNVAMLAQLSTMTAGETMTHDIAIGFGSTHDAAMAQAAGSLAEGYDALLRKYNGQDGTGWEDYLNGLTISPPCAARLETTASSST